MKIRIKYGALLLNLSILIGIVLVVWLLIESRGHPFSYFSTRCINYRQKDFTRRLNDRILDYSDKARLRGVSPSKNEKELREKISAGLLVKVRTGRLYIVDELTFSSPYVTRDTKKVLDEIARRFREKVEDKGLRGSKFFITSLTRKTESLRNLRRYNTNSSVNSPHLYGNAFDISYKRFSVNKFILTSCDKRFLKDALAEVIWQMRNEGKCWATYERMQNCYHVVAR